VTTQKKKGFAMFTWITRLVILLICGFVTGCLKTNGGIRDDLLLYDIVQSEETTLGQKAPTLGSKRIVVVGESHSSKDHHEAQLAVIRSLHELEIRVVVGLEMFRADSQVFLDRWVNGDMSRQDFKKAYHDNWNLDWSLYSMIFEFAREKGVPLVGLNVPPEITKQVARMGFESLSEEQRGELPDVTCDVSKAYMDFIREVFGAHGHGGFQFTYFCEAQLVWDTAMAVNALNYIKTFPDSTMVILTGSAHARKRGIPSQIAKLANPSIAVLLPEVPGHIEPGNTGPEEADYIYRMH
jgi:uncharacterized iron-regulated protein